MRVAFLVAELGRSGGMARDPRLGARARRRACWCCAATRRARRRRRTGCRCGRSRRCASRWTSRSRRGGRRPTRCGTCRARRRVVLLQNLDAPLLPRRRAGRPAGRARPCSTCRSTSSRSSPHLRARGRALRPRRARARGARRASTRRSSRRRRRGRAAGRCACWSRASRRCGSRASPRRSPPCGGCGRRPRSRVVAPDPDAARDARRRPRRAAGWRPRRWPRSTREHDVLLKLSRFEGLGLPVLEAFHVGRPCVVTPFGGREDFVEHGVERARRRRRRRARHHRGARPARGATPALRARLGEGALATAARWPSREAAAAAFAAALEAILAAEPPPRRRRARPHGARAPADGRDGPRAGVARARGGGVVGGVARRPRPATPTTTAGCASCRAASRRSSGARGSGWRSGCGGSGRRG